MKHCIPNAEVAVRSTPVKVQRIPVIELSMGIASTPPKPTLHGPKGDYEFSVERLHEIMQEEYDTITENRAERVQMGKRLHTKASLSSRVSPVSEDLSRCTIFRTVANDDIASRL